MSPFMLCWNDCLLCARSVRLQFRVSKRIETQLESLGVCNIHSMCLFGVMVHVNCHGWHILMCFLVTRGHDPTRWTCWISVTIFGTPPLYLENNTNDPRARFMRFAMSLTWLNVVGVIAPKFFNQVPNGVSDMRMVCDLGALMYCKCSITNIDIVVTMWITISRGCL